MEHIDRNLQTSKFKIDSVLESTISSHRGPQKYFPLSSSAIRKGSRKNRLYSRPLTPLDQLLASEHIDQNRKEELIALRERLDPLELAERVDQKLQQIWQKARYRYKPPKTKIETRKEQQELSQEKKETLEDIASIFGITVYVRTHKEGKLVAINNG